MLAGLRHAQIGKNLHDAQTRLHSLFPARGTVKQALGRVEPKAPLQCLESRHPNLILIAPSTPGKRIQDQLQAWLHETGERSFQENDVDQLPLWMRVQDIEAAVHATAGTSEAVILEQITDEGSLLILREPILLARLMTFGWTRKTGRATCETPSYASALHKRRIEWSRHPRCFQHGNTTSPREHNPLTWSAINAGNNQNR